MKHLSVLAGAGLVRHHKEGRVRVCELRAEPLAEIDRWLAFYRHFWNGQLHSLARHFEPG